MKTKLLALLFGLALASSLASCGPPSCQDACEDRCDEHPGSCEPNGVLFCQQACPSDRDDEATTTAR